MCSLGLSSSRLLAPASTPPANRVGCRVQVSMASPREPLSGNRAVAVTLGSRSRGSVPNSHRPIRPVLGPLGLLAHGGLTWRRKARQANARTFTELSDVPRKSLSRDGVLQRYDPQCNSGLRTERVPAKKSSKPNACTGISAHLIHRLRGRADVSGYCQPMTLAVHAHGLRHGAFLGTGDVVRRSVGAPHTILGAARSAGGDREWHRESRHDGHGTLTCRFSVRSRRHARTTPPAVPAPVPPRCFRPSSDPLTHP
jgi:hypothetical protein